MMNCADTQLELAPFAAGELNADEAAAVAAHTALCADCAAELAREIEMRRLLGDLPLHRCPAGVAAEPDPAPRRSARAPATRAAWPRAFAAAAALAATVAGFALLPGRLVTTQPTSAPSAVAPAGDSELDAARRDMIYTLHLTASILDRAGRHTLSDVFSQRLPNAVTGSLLRSADTPQGG